MCMQIQRIALRGLYTGLIDLVLGISLFENVYPIPFYSTNIGILKFVVINRKITF